MNRAQRRASNVEGRRRQKMPWDSFQDVTREAIEKVHSLGGDPLHRPDKVLQNNKYIVQVFYNQHRDGRYYDRVMIRRSDSEPIYSWTDLQRLKNECFGEEIEAIQFFPKESELTDVANLYWMWIDVDFRKEWDK